MLEPQSTPEASPWTIRHRLRMILWEWCWTLFCSWTPKPFNRWRLLWLRVFGTAIHGTPFVHQRARIAIPWNLTLHHRACLGDRTNVYSLGLVDIGEAAIVAQEAFLCTGTHDFTAAALPLVTRPIKIGSHAFIGARAFILPGVTIGDRAIVGACSVVTKDVAQGVTVAGNPASPVRQDR